MLGLLESLYGIIAFLFVLYYYYKMKFNFWKKRGVIGPEPTLLFGNTKDLILRKKSLVDYYKEIYNKYKHAPLIGIFDQTEPLLLVNDPELIKDVLITDSAVFSKRGFFRSETAEPLDHNIFFVDTEKAQPIRAKVSPIFTPSKLRSSVPLLLQRSQMFKDWLDTLLSQNKQINYRQVAAKYTADLTSISLFGYDMQTFGDNGDRILQYFDKKTNANKWKVTIRELLPEIVLNNKIYHSFGFHLFGNAEQMQYFVEFVKEIDSYRKKYGIVRQDITEAIHGLKENKKLTEITDHFIVANIFAFFFAAYETSSVTITNTLYELAVNQSIQDKLRQEIKSVRETNNKKSEEITYDDINAMSYLDAVFKETLRRYPVLDLLRRKARSTYTFKNFDVTIPKNQLIGIPICGIHSNPEIYPNPEVYDPERFIGEAAKARHSMSFFPFGYGSRNCIGERFGILQTKISIITIVENYIIEPCENTRMAYNKEVLVQQTKNMYLKLTKIN